MKMGALPIDGAAPIASEQHAGWLLADGFGGLVNAFADFRQGLVGVFFFGQVLAQLFLGVCVAERCCPRAERAVGGDFVVLNFLCERDDDGIHHFRIGFFAHHFLGFFDQAGHRFALLGFGRFFRVFECGFDTFDLFFGFFQMCGEGVDELFVGGLFNHFRQGFEQLLFCVVDIAEFVVKGICQAYRVT